MNSPFLPLDVAFLSVDVALDAFLNDNFVVSSLVRDADVDLKALDVHFHSSFAQCFATTHFLLSTGCLSMF